MKKIIGLIALASMLVCMLVSCTHTHYFDGEWEVLKPATCTENGEKVRYCYCGEKQTEIIYYTGESEVEKDDVITVEDGYLIVNGVKTEYKACTEPVISVVDGYIAVNGVKTEYKVATEDVVEVNDGYLVVNGVNTEYKVYTEPVISVIDGYVAVNGVKTEYLVATQCNHIWNSETTEPTCSAGGYDTMTCPLCDKSVRVNETDPIAHVYQTTYTINDNYHWFKCSNCEAIKDKEAHSLDDEGVCTVCNQIIENTPGVLYDVSADSTYAEVIGYEGTSKKVKIAEEFNGLPVKNICSKAFYENTTITDVVIPDSVINIEENAFGWCSKLSNVVFGKNVASIGNYAFQCTNLDTIVIPDTVTNIGADAFQCCTKLKSVIIGNGTMSIGKYAFANCYLLEKITLGNSLVDIGEGIFLECNNLSFTEYEECKYLGTNDNPYHALILVTNKNYSNYEIHPDTKTISSEAFKDCTRITSITLPEGLNYIGFRAFQGCVSLASITVPDSVTCIGDSAFYNCNNISYVIIGKGVKTISDWAFYSCTRLTDIYYSGTEDAWYDIEINITAGNFDFYMNTQKHFDFIASNN